MASKLSPATPRQKLQRSSGLEADRSTPAAKTGASMFGDSSPKLSTDRRSPRPQSAEKRAPVSRGAELHQVQEELAKTKEQLALMEKSKSNILQDLARSRRQVDDLTAKLQEASDIYKSDRLHSGETELSLKGAEDWQLELDFMKQRYETAVRDLQANKLAMENLKHELIVCSEAKDEAVRLAGEAMNAAESTAKRVEELSAELLMAKGQMFEDVGDGDLMICNGDSDPEPALVSAIEDDLQGPDQKLVLARSVDSERLEKQLQDADAEIQQLRLEFSSAKADYSSRLQKAIDDATGASSELEALKQELDVARTFELQANNAQSKMEQLQLELDTVKGNELKKAEKEITAALSEVAALKQQLALAQEFELQLKEAMSNGEKLQLELDASKETERIFKSQLVEIASKLEQTKTELADSKEAERNYSLQLADMKSMVNQLNDELAVVKEAQDIYASRDCVTANVDKDQKIESTVLASLAIATSQLEETQRSLVEVTLEKAVLVSSLESLQTNIERNNEQLAAMKELETSLTEKVEALTQELTEVKSGNERESALLREKLTSSAAVISSLEAECVRQKSELVAVAEKESIASTKCADLSIKLEHSQSELAELTKKELLSTENLVLLEMELENSRKELSSAKESESSLFSKIETLSNELEARQREILSLKGREADLDSRLALLNGDMEKSQQELLAMKERESIITVKMNCLSAELAKNNSELSIAKEKQSSTDSTVEALLKDLEEKRLEVAELNQKYTSADAKAASLLLDLERNQDELAELKKRESRLCAKASALSVVLASLRIENEDKTLKLAEREVTAKSEATQLNAELATVKLKLEEAIVAAKAAREDADKIQVSLQSTIAEKDQAMQHAQEAKAEAARNQEDAKAALTKAEAARDEAFKAKEAARFSELAVQKGAEELRTLKGELQVAQDEILSAKREGAAIREELEAVKILKQKINDELEEERKVARLAKEQMEALSMEIIKEKEQAKVAAVKIQAALDEAKSLKEEASRNKRNEEEAVVACKTVEEKLQAALAELASLKLQVSSLAVPDGGKEPIDKEAALRDEPTSKDLDALRRKLAETEEQLVVALANSESSTMRSEKLQRDLEAAQLEKDASERALVEVQQLLAETEKAKTNMEAEIQRLLDGSKQWQMAKDAIDIPVHSEAATRVLPIGECREEKPQPDTVEDVSSYNDAEHDSGHLAKMVNDPLTTANVTKEELEEGKDEAVGLRREDLACSSLKKEDVGQDGHEVASQEELSLPTKRKKKTLFVRLGTLLEKKKHSHTP